MPRIILAIRDPGLPDHLSVHDTETEARAELAAYILRQAPQDLTGQPIDDTLIDAWFADRRAHYAIGEVTTSPATVASS